MQARRSVFRLGVYKPEWGDEWPWAYESENGQYLSEKYRVCSEQSAAKFMDLNEAREFFHGWKRKGEFRLEIVECKEYVEVPDPVYPDDHPKAILDRINQHEMSSVRKTAFYWFLGEDINILWSRTTLNKHRQTLLRYDIDINQVPDYPLEQDDSPHDDQWHLEKPTMSRLK